MKYTDEKGLYLYSGLEPIGIRAGSIVEEVVFANSKCLSHSYILFVKDPVNDYEVGIRCNVGEDNKMYIANLHEHATKQDVEHKLFAKTNELERQEFVQTCLDRLKEPIGEGPLVLEVQHYAQIIGLLAYHKLLNFYELSEINKKLMTIHNVDLLKYYHDHHGSDMISVYQF